MIWIYDINLESYGSKKLFEYINKHGYNCEVHEDNTVMIKIKLDYANFVPMVWAIFHSLNKEDYSYIKIE